MEKTFGVIWILILIAVSPAIGADFCIAPNGNDANPGTANKPFATLERARQAVRALPRRNQPITVLLRGGTYFMEKQVVFSVEDSGTEAAPVVYAAWPGETPVLSGGREIREWVSKEAGVYSARLPEVKEGKWNFMQLFVDGKRCRRPRLPKAGYFHVAKAMEPTDDVKKGKGDDSFGFHGTDILPGWHNLDDVEVINFHNWFISRLRIESVNTQNKIVTFTGRTRSDAEWGKLKKGMRFIVENVREALSPGEFYLDRKTGTLTYMGEPKNVIAPRLDQLIILDNAQHLAFRGLTLMHSNWTTSPEGDSQSQAAFRTPGAFSATHARYITIENCTISQTGGYAIELGIGCRDNRIEGCRMIDLGAGGIKIGTPHCQNKEENTVSHNIVRDNLIAHGGRIHTGAVGIWIGNADHTLVEHNDIYDLYYTGISVGWTWGEGPSGANHNTIQYNHIHHIGQGVLSDMGGIYTLGISPGTVLQFNHIHDIQRVAYGGWGIYYDEGSRGIVSENNLIYRTQDGGFHQHYGQENIFRNNILGPTQTVQVTGSRITLKDRVTVQTRPAFTFEHNIVLGWGAKTPDQQPWPDLKLNPPRNLYTLDHNLYWNFGKPVVIPKRDKNSLTADPLFVDPKQDNYTLKEESPALKVGFKPFDISTAGRSKREPADLDPKRWSRIFPEAK